MRRFRKANSAHLFLKNPKFTTPSILGKKMRSIRKAKMAHVLPLVTCENGASNMRRIRKANSAHLFKTHLAKTAHVVSAKTAHLLLAKTAHLLGHAPFLRMCEYGASFGKIRENFGPPKKGKKMRRFRVRFF